jgi:hypothetical protein
MPRTLIAGVDLLNLITNIDALRGDGATRGGATTTMTTSRRVEERRRIKRVT